MVAISAALASGYHGPPELTLSRALTEWTLDPWALAIAALLGGLYLSGARRVRPSAAAWPLGRTVAFCGLGLRFSVIATLSLVGGYPPVLVYARSGPTIPLLLVGPPVLA